MEYKIFKNVQKANKEGGEVIIEKKFQNKEYITKFFFECFYFFLRSD